MIPRKSGFLFFGKLLFGVLHMCLETALLTTKKSYSLSYSLLTVKRNFLDRQFISTMKFLQEDQSSTYVLRSMVWFFQGSVFSLRLRDSKRVIVRRNLGKNMPKRNNV